MLTTSRHKNEASMREADLSSDKLLEIMASSERLHNESSRRVLKYPAQPVTD